MSVLINVVLIIFITLVDYQQFSNAFESYFDISNIGKCLYIVRFAVIWPRVQEGKEIETKITKTTKIVQGSWACTCPCSCSKHNRFSLATPMKFGNFGKYFMLFMPTIIVTLCTVHALFMPSSCMFIAWTGYEPRLESYISCAWILFSCAWSHAITSWTCAIIKGSNAWTITVHGHELTKEFMFMAWILHEHGMICIVTTSEIWE